MKRLASKLRRKALKTRPARQRLSLRFFPLQAGETVSCDGHDLHAAENVPQSQIRRNRFEPGSNITMYGVLVGKASQNISRGQLLSTKKHSPHASSYERRNQIAGLDCAGRLLLESRTFPGYRRPDGQVGTRNYWIVLPLVLLRKTGISRF